MNEGQPHNPELSISDWLRMRRRRLWIWPAVGAVMILLELLFLVWNARYAGYLGDCWKVMLEMEISMLGVAPEQRLSVMLPLWITLGTLAYAVAVVLIFRFWRLERRYLELLRKQD